MTPQCSNCGHVNPSFASSCTNCGVPLPGAQPQQQKPPVWGAPANAAPEYGASSFGQMPFSGMQLEYIPEVVEAQKSARNALIFSIVGIFCCGVILGLIGIIMGAQARSTLKRYGVAEGQGLALAAMIVGGLDLVFFVVGIIVQVLVN
jgi:hypothetical protein